MDILEPTRVQEQDEWEPIFEELDGLDKCEPWLFQDVLYGLNPKYSYEQKRLLVLKSADEERQKFERLKARYASDQSDAEIYHRIRIPEEVRIMVWRRDEGKCARCGSRENLEYDHIIPVYRGGSNTVRNIELFCQPCNREKGDRIQ